MAYKKMEKPPLHYYGQPNDLYDIHGQLLPSTVSDHPVLSLGQSQPVAPVPNMASLPNMQNMQNMQNVLAMANVQSGPSQSMAINMGQTITPAQPANVPLQNHSIHTGIHNGGMVGMAISAPYFSGTLVNPIINQDLRSQSLPNTLNQGQSGSGHHPGAGGKFSEADVELLHQLYSMGERHKWKQITKEINQRSALRRGDDVSGISDDERGMLSKNVSPTYVIKQYQNLLGLPKHLHYFGVLGLSVPYVVAEKGWDELVDTETFSSPE